MPEIRGERVTLAPLEAGHADGLRAMRADSSVADWWGALEEDFPLQDEPESTRFAILDGGELAGMIQFSEEHEPDYRHAEVDIFLGPAFQGRGLGTDAMVALCDHLMAPAATTGSCCPPTPRMSPRCAATRRRASAAWGSRATAGATTAPAGGATST